MGHCHCANVIFNSLLEFSGASIHSITYFFTRMLFFALILTEVHALAVATMRIFSNFAHDMTRCISRISMRLWCKSDENNLVSLQLWDSQRVCSATEHKTEENEISSYLVRNHNFLNNFTETVINFAISFPLPYALVAWQDAFTFILKCNSAKENHFLWDRQWNEKKCKGDDR